MSWGISYPCIDMSISARARYIYAYVHIEISETNMALTNQIWF